MNPLWRVGWLVGPECVWVIRLPRGGRTPSFTHEVRCRTWLCRTPLFCANLQNSCSGGFPRQNNLLSLISSLTRTIHQQYYQVHIAYCHLPLCTLHATIYNCTHCTLEYSAPAQQLLQWTLCSPAENLLLSWLSHSASILTHLNESVSRSSEGGYLPCHHPPVCRWTEHASFDFW